jgi:ferredoxin
MTIVDMGTDMVEDETATSNPTESFEHYLIGEFQGSKNRCNRCGNCYGECALGNTRLVVNHKRDDHAANFIYPARSEACYPI